MKRRLRYLFILLLLLGRCSFCLLAREISNSSYTYSIREDGTISSLSFPDFDVEFFGEIQKAGPVIYVQNDDRREYCTWTRINDCCFSSEISGISARLEYLTSEEIPTFRVILKNNGSVDFTPVKVGLALGVDTYMDAYPQWLSKFFPTLLMNEKNHFYGYFQSPQGHLLGVCSPDPIASWSVDYNLAYYDIPQFWFYGHRIESVNLDLINALPLPEHNPQDMWLLRSGEERSWTISFVPIQSLDTFEKDLASVSALPMMDMSRTSFAPSETVSFKVYSKESPQILIEHEDGISVPFSIISSCEGEWNVSARLDRRGQYDLSAICGEYTLSSVLLVRERWADVMKNARKAAMINHQKPSSHVESWYGFHSAFLAARHFPDTDLDRALDERFALIYNKVFDPETAEPLVYASRIQNTSSTIGMLVDRYQAFGRIEDLKQASDLADWLIENNQAEDGAYMNGGVRYTSVIYVAKSLMELYLVENKLGLDDSFWYEKAEEHYFSIKRAIDELVDSKGDFQTEGEMTFEDGMISCSALQIGMFALLQEDEGLRQHYTDVMLEILHTHDCLTQLKVNDGRRRGGTMRYWEAQYDVLMLPNMINSPHGWSAWRAYASYYAYLLTQDERYLIETFNAAGAFANLIDRKTGRLRWAFVVDPYLQVRQIAGPVKGVTFDDVTTGNPHPDFYGSREFTIGEQYVDMISSWQPVNSQDNDVHEVFKFIEEAVLTNAFIVEREDGTISGYNCKVERRGNRLIVTPDEKQIVNLQTNLRSDYKIKFKTL